jgi:cytochrome c-type biogenesis protein CcmE
MVRYTGSLPDLFHEEKGMIAEGRMSAQGIFEAKQIMAKHDENYMPKNVYKALRENN